MLSVDWFWERMRLTKKFVKEVDVEEVAICVPLEFKTACLIYELSKNVKVYPTKLDEFSTKETAVRWLEENGIKIFRRRDAVKAEYFLDCSAVLSRTAEKIGKGEIKVVELTRTGEEYLRNLKIKLRAISVDSSRLKEIESSLGTPFGLLEALLKLNIYLPSKKVKIVGFGKVGKGCAELLRKLGCNVSVWDLKEERQKEAISAGFNVSEDLKADLVILCTDSKVDFLVEDAIIVNMGAEIFKANGEIIRDYGAVKAFKSGEKVFYVVSDGYAANLAIGSGTPIEIMDLTFSAAVLGLNYLKKDFEGIIPLPKEIEDKIFREMKNLISL
ncbi:MAG: NAD(P)-dependent oxidoreductase [Archaeoglobaceae archaeon]